MDDVIAPRGLDRHIDALAEADFSYGDMELIDVSGRRLGRRFFDQSSVPGRVDDVLTIRDRNFLGFSNTAVRADQICPSALIVPDGIVAADWWFFTMLLLGGLRGKKTDGPVAEYRLHDSNTLGAGAPTSVSQAIDQSKAMLLHYRAFSAHPALAARIGETEKVLAALQIAPATELTAQFRPGSDQAGAWFEGLGRIVEKMNACQSAAAVAQ